MTSRELLVDRDRVNSSCIASAGYSPAHEVLDVEFRSGIVYRYLAVPHDEYTRFAAAPSLGVHLNRFIKGRFAYVRLIADREMTQ